jgi:hypothetical protein
MSSAIFTILYCGQNFNIYLINVRYLLQVMQVIQVIQVIQTSGKVQMNVTVSHQETGPEVSF